MKMGEFREAASVSSSPSSPLRTPSQSPNLNLLRQNFFHGDFSPTSNRFSFNSSSDFSLSSSFSNGFCPSDDSSSPFASPPFTGIIPNPNKHNHSSSPVTTYHHDSLLHEKKSVNHDLGLCEDLYRMKIRDDFEDDNLRYGRTEALGSIPESDFALDPLSSFNGAGDGFVSAGGSPYGFFRSPKDSSSCDFRNDDKRNIFGNNTTHQIQDSIAANSRQIGWPSFSTSNGGGGNSPYINGHELLGIGSNRGASDMLPLFSSSASKASEPFSSDESFFVESKSLDHHHHQRSSGNNTEICHQSLPNMCDIQGYVYLMAKDQHGCRFLQMIFDQGTPVDAMVIFNEVIAHVVELMMDPFGNYLMQKLLDVCSEEQRTQIVLVATAEPGQLIRISLNAYG